jgi:hypothetical protein
VPSELESALERRCRDYAEINECLLLKIQGVRGWPDRLLIVPGGTVAFLEFKREGKQARPLQQHILEDLHSRGFSAGVLDNFQQFQTLLRVLKHPNGDPTNTNPEV